MGGIGGGKEGLVALLGRTGHDDVLLFVLLALGVHVGFHAVGQHVDEFAAGFLCHGLTGCQHHGRNE